MGGLGDGGGGSSKFGSSTMGSGAGGREFLLSTRRVTGAMGSTSTTGVLVVSSDMRYIVPRNSLSESICEC